MKRFIKPSPVKPKRPEPRILTQEEDEMVEIFGRSMRAPREIDNTLFCPEAKFERPKDETHPEVKELSMRKGFIRASQVFEIISKSQKPSKTPPEEASTSKLPLSDIWLPEEVDDETLAIVQEQEELNKSLGSLTQKLNTSQRASELLDYALSQNPQVDLDVTRIDLEAVMSDEEEDDEALMNFVAVDEEKAEKEDENKILNTQALEFGFRSFETQPEVQEATNEPCCSMSLSKAFQPISHQSSIHHKAPTITNINEPEIIPETEAFEMDFMCLSTQPEPPKISRKKKPKPKQIMMETEDLEANFFEIETQPECREQKPIPDTEALEFGFENLETQPDPSHKQNPRGPCSTGFQVSSGLGNSGMFSGFPLTPKLNQADADDDFGPVNFLPAPNALSGFGFSSAKGLKLSTGTLDKFQKAVDDLNEKIDSEFQKADDIDTFRTPVAVKTFRGSSMKFTTPGAPQPVSFLSTPESFADVRSSGVGGSTSSFMSGFKICSGREASVTSYKMKKISENFAKEDLKVCQELEDTPARPISKKVRLDFGDSPISPSPFIMSRFLKGIHQHSTPLMSRAQNSSSNISDVPSINDSVLDAIPSSPKRRKFAKTRLVNKFEEEDDEILLKGIRIHEMEYSFTRISDEVKAARREALKEQKESIKGKPDSDRAKMAGSVFMMKSSRDRRKVRDYVEAEKPASLNRHQITWQNALYYKFSMGHFVGEEVWTTNTTGISLADNARLIMDDQANVGIEQIKLSFLASPGVDPKLVPEKWIENTFKLLLLKLSFLENSFEKFETFELLSPENVLLQMKYRYDREIDRSHRSAIKKIVELNEIPARRMVLKVLDIQDNPKAGCELILTDGWYTITTSIDRSLADAVDRKKIQIGTKIITSFAELQNCTGFDPLEMPEVVRLKIHANATRRTAWHEKMGFCRNPNPIGIQLDSVLATGGTIGKITVVITHVYNIIYVDSSNEKKEFRSEKLQHRVQNRLDVLNFAIHESIVRQVHTEMMNELQERVALLKESPFKIKDLEPAEICDLLEAETDPDEVIAMQKQIDEETNRAIEKVRDVRQYEVNEMIRQKLGEKEKNLKQLLKFRVVDAANPRKTALVSWWSPNEDVEMIKEGQVVEIVNSHAGPFTNEIHVTAGTGTVIKTSKTRVEPEKIAKFLRKETEISGITSDFKPDQDEFDVVCVVVRVTTEKVKELFKVYVADEAANLLCINFWSPLYELAFDDVVVEGQICFVRNLQWRASRGFEKVPQAFVVSDTTLFITNPKNPEQKSRLESLRDALGDIKEFINKCNKKIADLNLDTSLNKENLHQSSVKPSVVASPPRKVLTRSLTSNTNTPDFSRKRLGATLGGFSRSFSKPQKSEKSSAKRFNKSLNKPIFGASSVKKPCFNNRNG